MERGEPMDEPKRVDPRTRKTKRAIRNAVAKLLSEYDLNDITVREIAELSEINRKTFYRYYSGIYQVLDEIENEIVSSFDQILGHIDFKKDLENPYHIFERLTATINTDIEFFGYLLSLRGNVNLVSKIAALLKAKAKVALMAIVSIDEKTLEVMLEYMISGMVAVYQQWFNSARAESIEKLSETISVLAFSGINGLLERPRA